MATRKPRRDFLARTLAVAPWAVAASLSWPTGSVLLFGEPKRGKIRIPLAQIKEGITPLLSAKLYLHKAGDALTVFDAHCTHMGCILHYDTDNHVFNCPCHHSRFDDGGHRLRGPAKRDLDRVTYVITGDAIVIG